MKKKHIPTTGRVAVAVSGGVDSMVSVWLLKQTHPDLCGIHFVTGYERQPVNIENLEKQLNIPIHCIDFRDIFEKHVVQYFIDTYCKGRTPNPCLICNKTIKFGALYDAAVDIGADTLATGHYAKILHDRAGNAFLVKGKDPLKDQSYFLSMLSREQLRHTIFPLADLTKQEVVQLARKNGLMPSQGKESQDICFIHGTSFADFIVSKTAMAFTPGAIVTLNNTVIGTHRGLHCYTIGQRRGLNCPGPAPYYVKKIDIKKNRLIVAFKEELFEQELYVKNLNWPCSDFAPPTAPVEVITKIRYSHSGAPSTLIPSPESSNSDGVKIVFKTPQLAVTPGQGAVFYDKDKVVGAGIIQ